MPANISQLERLAKLIRYYILTSTTAAGSGHPSSSLSAVELMAALIFGGFFCFDADNPDYHNNDRLIFSKGHAAPLFYGLWAVAGQISEEELMTLRQFNSRLEGHPSLKFPYAEAATGSLGQGLSIGAGMAINGKLDKLPYRTYVLLGDSEMVEGSNWEAMQLASYYKLNNLIGIIDVNRLGQRGETMLGYKVEEYQKRVSAFGWEVFLIDDGHNLSKIIKAYQKALVVKNKPVMIIAKTVKGKGVKIMENKDGWHGKALNQEQLSEALKEMGEVDKEVRRKFKKPISNIKYQMSNQCQMPLQCGGQANVKFAEYVKGQLVATRQAYGNALVKIFPKYPNIVALDAEVGNSTFAEVFKKHYPGRFIECFIAEQNMVGMAQGLSKLGKIPYVSSFAAFFTRAFDQIRMSQYSDSNIKFVGSHAGVSIGADGASQMGLEDIAMFRTILNGAVLYPSDAVSCEKLVQEAAKYQGIVYIRTTRAETSVLYSQEDNFEIGGSCVVKSSQNDIVTIIAAGITLHEALAAYQELAREGIFIRVIDCYSIKPIDQKILKQAARETKAIITVEDHFAEGGLGEAAASALSNNQIPVHIMAVRKMPKSGKMQELLDYEEISKDAIIKKVKSVLS
ncbi:MAG: transketolase [Patescibacteria group bacterium]